MVVAGGKDWSYHLAQPATEEALTEKKWDYVVLQDLSTKATHLGNRAEFVKNGELFYKRIREHSPNAKIVLYETWARAKGYPFYTGVSGPKSFTDPSEMTGEVEKGYTELHEDLEAIEPGQEVSVAPVGAAFALCLQKYPDIDLHWKDKHHASVAGNYLAALVIYATIFQDSPLGATMQFFGVSLDSKEARKLQEIAAQVVKN